MRGGPKDKLRYLHELGLFLLLVNIVAHTVKFRI